MSMGREAAIERDVDATIAYMQHMDRLIKGLWTQKNGKLISIHEMTVNHILNCIRMLQDRQDDIAEGWLNRFSKELQERDNMTVCVVALDSAGFIRTVTSCDLEDAQKYAKYYRAIGYHSRVMTYEQLDEYQKRERKERLCTDT